MKKLFTLLMPLCLLASLAACQADDPENLFGTATGPEALSTQSADAPDLPVYEEGYYQYGNMQKNGPSGDFMRYGDNVMFVDFGYGECALFTYDMNTGEVRPLCQDATCDHEPDECATGGVSSNLESYGGKLYGLVVDPRGTSGGDKVMELKNGRFEEVVRGAGCFWHAGGDLYAISDDKSLLVFEGGSGEPRMLLEEYTGMWSVVFGRYLYANSFANNERGIFRLDLEAEAPQPEVLVKNALTIVDGEHIYYAPMDSYHLYRCNMDGSDPELLLDKPVLPASWNFDDEYFYFRLYTDHDMTGEDSNAIYRLAKDDPTQIEKLVELPESVFQVFTVPGYDKMFVKAVSVTREDGQNVFPLYVVATDGSSVELLEFPEG